MVHLSACVRQNDTDRIGMESGAVTSSNRSKMAVTGAGSPSVEGKQKARERFEGYRIYET